MFHYVYRITNKVVHKHYYGVRSSWLNPSEDLGKTYFSSSTDKVFITDQKARPYNYKYKVVSVYNTREEALAMEIRLHTRFKVGASTHFYNRANQTSAGFDTTGMVQSEELCQYKSLLFSGTGNPFYGKSHTAESKMKIKQNHANTNGKDNPMFGITHTANTKALISKANSGVNNGRALTINIYNSDNALIHSCTGTFEKVCKENGYPFGALKKTCVKGTTMSNPHKRNKEFTGWYARKAK